MIKKIKVPEIVSAGNSLIIRCGYALPLRYRFFNFHIYLLEWVIDQAEKTILKKEKIFFLTIKKKLLRFSDIERIEYCVQTKGTKSEIIKSFYEEQVESFSIYLISRQNERHLVWNSNIKFVKDDTVNQIDLEDDEGQPIENYHVHDPEMAADLESVLLTERLAHILDLRIKTIPDGIDPFRDCPGCGRQAARVRYCCSHCLQTLGSRETPGQK